MIADRLRMKKKPSSYIYYYGEGNDNLDAPDGCTKEEDYIYMYARASAWVVTAAQYSLENYNSVEAVMIGNIRAECTNWIKVAISTYSNMSTLDSTFDAEERIDNVVNQLYTITLDISSFNSSKYIYVLTRSSYPYSASKLYSVRLI